MTDTTTDAPPREPGRLTALSPLASHRRLIGGAGVFSLVAGALFGSKWVGVHREFWQGQVNCSASIDGGPLFRQSVSIAAVLAGITIILTLVRIASSRPARRGHIAAYWAASVTLWLMLVPMATTTVVVNDCLRIPGRVLP